jgi:hypothetical protein
MGPIQPPTFNVFGSTLTVTLVTEAVGVATMGMAATFPAVLTTLAATQQLRLAFNGSTMYHQLKSELLPTICEVCPTCKPLSTTHPVPGPKRQLTGTSLGNAIGTLGVDVSVGGCVAVGEGVSVGVSVGRGCVADGSTEGDGVGVSVPGALDGRLQACKRKVKTINRVSILDFIVSPLLPNLSYLYIKRTAIAIWVQVNLLAMRRWSQSKTE